MYDGQEDRRGVVRRSEKIIDQDGFKVYQTSYFSMGTNPVTLYMPEAWIIATNGMMHKINVFHGKAFSGDEMRDASELVQKVIKTLSPGTNLLKVDGGAVRFEIAPGCWLNFVLPQDYYAMMSYYKDPAYCLIRHMSPVGTKATEISFYFSEQPRYEFNGYSEVGFCQAPRELLGVQAKGYGYFGKEGTRYKEVMLPCQKLGLSLQMHIKVCLADEEENVSVDSILKSMTLDVVSTNGVMERKPLSDHRPDYEAMGCVSNELVRLRQWNEPRLDGAVLVGRLEMPKDALVAALTPLYCDASFCAGIYMTRKLIFYAHGYKPLTIDDFSQLMPYVFDVGTLRFVKSSPEDIRQLRFVPKLEIPGTNAPLIECSLIVENNAYLNQDDGHALGAPVRVLAASKVVSPGVPVIFDGLSKIPYKIMLKTPEYVTKYVMIDQNTSRLINLGEIALTPANNYRISYKVRTRRMGGGWLGDDAIRETNVIVDGDFEMKLSWLTDAYGRPLKLRFDSLEGCDVVHADYNYKFYELGGVEDDKLLSFDAIDVSEVVPKYNAELKDGQLYAMKQEAENGMEVEAIFYVRRR